MLGLAAVVAVDGVAVVAAAFGVVTVAVVLLPPQPVSMAATARQDSVIPVHMGPRGAG